MTWLVHEGDALAVLRELPAESAHTCVTSPPYWGLRDYGHDGQMGLESTPEEYVARMVEVFGEVRRVLRDDGTLWLNIGDSYATHAHGNGKSHDPKSGRQREAGRPNRRPIHGLKHKDLVGIPWMLAFGLRSDGWYLRSDIIWSKPNPMPESVRDRPTKAHEYVFMLSKSARYYWDQDAVREPAQDWGNRDRSNWKARDPEHNTSKPHTGGENGNFADSGRNIRSVWNIATQPFPGGAHFAVMPPALVEPCVKAGAPIDGVVLDPFTGAGTVGMVARRLQRSFVGIELNPVFAEMARRRIEGDAPLFNREAAK